MPDISDYRLLKTDQIDGVDADAPASRAWVWIVAAIVLVSAAAATYVVVTRRPSVADHPAPAAPAAAAQPTRPLGGEAERVDVPPLDQSDPVVRELVKRITSHPTALAWLATDGLIRRFTVVVSNVVDGETPARHLRTLTPSRSFQTVERGGETFTDPRSYDRYNAVAAAAASIDPDGAARVYATLKPRIEEAYADLGVQPASFDRALEVAIVSLLKTPVVEGQVRLRPKGIGWGYADPRLEDLTGAQKQLLRAGPRNVQLVQASLRRIALALGIPADHLP
jgi:hypothetical protein